MRRRLFVLKLVLSSALLAYVISRAQLSRVASLLGSLELKWVVLAFLLLFIGKVLTAVRWQLLLRAQGVVVPLRVLVPSLFVGQFFSSFLPSTVGGDAVRAYDTARFSRARTASVTAVVLDRLVGVCALALLAALALVFARGRGTDLGDWTTPVAVALVLSLGLCLALLQDRVARWTSGLARRTGFRAVGEKLERVFASVRLVGADRRRLVRAAVLSLALQVNVVGFYWASGTALSVPVAGTGYFVAVPLILIILLLPITINGIGLREGAFVLFFRELGAGAEVAIALSWLAFGLTLSHAVIGGVLFALRGGRLQALKPAAHDGRPRERRAAVSE